MPFLGKKGQMRKMPQISENVAFDTNVPKMNYH